MAGKTIITEGDIVLEQLSEEMDILMTQLHKEWELSKETKKEVQISFADAEDLQWLLVEELAGRIGCVDVEKLPFKAALEHTRECFVFLRLIKRIAKAKEKGDKKAMDKTFSVALDKEEWKLYREYLE